MAYRRANAITHKNNEIHISGFIEGRWAESDSKHFYGLRMKS
jgi:hypothetical protein